jgi:glutamate--glyoxylate aminotransferase
VFLTDGASVAVRMCLNALIRDGHDGILVPIPQYPLYSASIKLYGGSLVPYLLDEDKGWGMNVQELMRSVAKAKAEGIQTRGLVFINPGNPTGLLTVLSVKLSVQPRLARDFMACLFHIGPHSL